MEDKIPSPNSEYPDENSGPQIRPWVRYWARWIDVAVFAFLVGILASFFESSVVFQALFQLPDMVFGIVVMFTYAFIEPLMLTTWGTTPGKALLRIRLRKNTDEKPSYQDGMARSFRVWLHGLGAGIPIIAFFTLFSAYQRLTKQKTTSWDAHGKFGVRHQLVGALRTIVAVLIISSFVAIIFLGMTIEA